MELVEELGFDAVNAGGLDKSWRQQPGTSVYTSDLDAEAVRPALAEANPSAHSALRQATRAIACSALRCGRFRKGDGAARGRAVPSAGSPPTVVERGLPTTRPVPNQRRGDRLGGTSTRIPRIYPPRGSQKALGRLWPDARSC